MTKLSVNVNKFATLRNARGGNNPDIVQVVQDCERFGADGITIHPRPDERHITRNDVLDIASVVKTEFNIEGYPDDRFLKIVEEVRPTQVTLVPDGPDVLTSNAGWNTLKHKEFLLMLVERLKKCGTRVSIFVDPDIEMVKGAKEVGADRIELYTEGYATSFQENPSGAVKSYVEAANTGTSLGLGINAGHDLDLENLAFFASNLSTLHEVSIGHALVCDAIYFGLENTIPMYKRKLQ